MNSVNQPWAISDKHRARYGNTWADMDFEVKQLPAQAFQDNPMSVVIGTLIVAGRKVDVTLTDLTNVQTFLESVIAQIYSSEATTHEVRIKSTYVHLNVTEINRLIETINDSITTVTRKYQLGLYL